MTEAKSVEWFSATYTDAEKHNIAAALYPFVCLEEDDQRQDELKSALSLMLETLIDCHDPNLNKQTSENNLNDLLSEMTSEHAQDFLVMALVLCFFVKDNHQKRLNILLASWSDKFIVVDTLLDALRAIHADDLETIKDDKYIGEGFHNKIARQNGLKDLGEDEYKSQMEMMQKGKRIESLEEKYKLLIKEAPETTLGGALCKLLRGHGTGYTHGLSLPGEPHGFAEFFLWHDLTHVLSGNKTDFVGELGANAFTAASSNRAKYEILVWGLLQFNLGFSLAVVAAPGLNALPQPGALKKYCLSLIYGSRASLDVLDWPLVDMRKDLALPLADVRKRYNIKSID